MGDFKEMFVETHKCREREHGETDARDAYYTQWVAHILTASDREATEYVMDGSAYETDKHLAYFFETLNHFFG